MEDCGHGRFQWTLFTVLGLALMADGVECFVVAFVLPSAEKDLCLSNAEKGMLGKGFNDSVLLAERVSVQGAFYVGQDFNVVSSDASTVSGWSKLR